MLQNWFAMTVQSADCLFIEHSTPHSVMYVGEQITKVTNTELSRAMRCCHKAVGIDIYALLPHTDTAAVVS